MNRSRSVLVICRSAPYGSGRLRDALDLVMAFGAFEQTISLLLLDDAVMLLQPGQGDIDGSRNLMRLAGALPDYGISAVHVDAAALRERSLDIGLVAIAATAIDESAISGLIASHEVVLSV